jgi:DNA-binding transcriptional MerR regulator
VVTAIQTPRLLATKEVARALGCSVKTVRQTLVANGVLTPIRLSPQGYLRFRSEDVERLISGEARVP